MMRMIFSFLLLISVVEFSKAQKADTAYVIDDKPTLMKLKDIDPNEICTVTILKYASGSVQHDFPSVTIIVTTKRFATLRYQHNIEAFSNDYKKHLDSAKHDDSNFFYVLNGQPLEAEDKRIKTLFDIHENDIKSVNFMGKFYKGVVNNQKEIVLIQTK